jgi:tetratricopeptide (TPR) repeat protein
MVGRDAEVGVLVSLFDEVAASGLPRLLTVFGPAGVGKSRVVAEAVTAIVARRPGTAVLRGRCVSAGHGITYWALGEILRDACGIALGDPAPVAQAKLWDGLRAILGRLEQPGDLEATVYALAATAGISLPGSPLDRLEPRKVGDELARAWPRFATACAAAGPALLVIEDLHWAGDQLLQMLELAVVRASGPLVVLATARPELAEAYPGFGASGEGFASISLRPLGADHSRALVDGLAPAGRLDARLREEILARAEGNPLFLEELVLHLANAGASRLPDTLHSVLAARIDSLPDLDKRVLQEASVVGRTFWEAPVERALAGASVGAQLLALERRGFVRRQPVSTLPGQAELSFRHALIHDVAYASIPRARRARTHAEVGAWLEELAGGRLDEFAEVLAYHFSAAAGEGADLAWGAEDRERVRAMALGYLLRAGGAARRRFAVVTAVELHEQALALAATERERLAVLEELGDDHQSAYHGEDSAGRYLEALEIARAERDRRAERSRLCGKLTMLMGVTPGAFRSPLDLALAERLVDEGLACADDDVSRAWLLTARGALAQQWPDAEPFARDPPPDPVPLEERIAGVEQALAVAGATGLPELAAQANYALSIVYELAGRHSDVLAIARRELDALPRAKSRFDQADILCKVAVHTVEISAGYEAALELARRAHALSLDTNPHQLMHATSSLLEALYHLGRWRELLPVFDEHLAAFEQEPAVQCQLARNGLLIGATVLMRTGDPERARSLAPLLGNPVADLARAIPWEARFAVACGDAKTAVRISEGKARQGRMYGPQHALSLLEALQCLEDWPAVGEALPTARANVAGNALLGPFCDRAEGLVHAHAGRKAAAVTGLRRALAGFERLRVPFEAAATRERLAELVPSVQATPLLEEALATYALLGARPHHEAVRSRLQAL